MSSTDTCRVPATGGPEVRHVRLAPNVTLVVSDDVGRLLDLTHGQFFALNHSGVRLLTTALKVGPDAAIEQVATEYQVATDVVRRDWDGIIAALVRAKLVTLRSPPAPASWFRLWWLLTVAWVTIRLLGWSSAVNLWRVRRVREEPIRWPDCAALVREVDRRLRSVAAVHPFNLQCKERALVAWHLLRNRYGLPAELVVGLLAYPFRAHAWVECDGIVVTDDALRCETFTPATRWT